MARNFRMSRFGGRGDVGEDVNPSAYIVNLADCMLVLACGFMVALISYWNIDVTPAEKIADEQLEAVSPEDLPEDVTQGGSYYIEAGTVYKDPYTGQLYMVQGDDGSGEGERAGSDSGSASASGAGAGSGAGNPSAGAGNAASPDDVRRARAAGGD